MTQDEADIFLDFVKICEGQVPAERVVRKADLKDAIQRCSTTTARTSST